MGDGVLERLDQRLQVEGSVGTSGPVRPASAILFAPDPPSTNAITIVSTRSSVLDSPGGRDPWRPLRRPPRCGSSPTVCEHDHEVLLLADDGQRSGRKHRVLEIALAQRRLAVMAVPPAERIPVLRGSCRSSSGSWSRCHGDSNR
jgi:hypothetical protein